MTLSSTRKDLVAQAEASEAALRDIWNTLSGHLTPPDLHASERAAEAAAAARMQASRLSEMATSAAETVAGKARANPYGAGLIGAGLLLMVIGLARGSEANRRTAERAQEHPVTSTLASLAIGAGIAALMPQNRSRLLALAPAAGVLLNQLRRMFQSVAEPVIAEDEPDVPAKPARKARAKTASTMSADAAKSQARKSSAKRTRKPAATKADSPAERTSGVTVN